MDNQVNNVTPLTQHRSGPSRTTAATGRVEWVCALTALTVVLSIPAWAQAQEIGGALTLEEARALARASSPEITAAAAAVEAAAGRERQAGAFPNPVLAYGREQTSPGGVTSAQDIIAIEQLLEVGGQRGARMAAARLRHQAAEARLAAAAAALDFEVARAYAEALAADRRAEVATMAAEQFGQATVVMTHRLTAGDVSGYANRRLRLEGGRYAALAAEARLEQRRSRTRLASLLGAPADTVVATLAPLDAPASTILTAPADSVIAAALDQHAKLRAARLEMEAGEAVASLARRERIPSPVALAGYKRERVPGDGSADGFVAGFSLPLPLWNRRGGAVQAAEAETRRQVAEVEVLRRRIVRETREAYEAVRHMDEQVEVLRIQLGDEAQAALGAAEAAYAEGEITLVEWLDTVRAYQEAEAAYASVLAESFVQRAALERVLGVALIR